MFTKSRIEQYCKICGGKLIFKNIIVEFGVDISSYECENCKISKSLKDYEEFDMKTWLFEEIKKLKERLTLLEKRTG